MNIRIIEAAEIEAVRSGEIEGDIYHDGEIYADLDSLRHWRQRRINAQITGTTQETTHGLIAE